MRLPVFAIERHRLLTDGVGVTTLVGAYGCPLQCKYCINPHAWDPGTLARCKTMSPEELYEQVKIDNLYFLATGGGVTFGGGESLLHADFINAFREVCGERWRLCVETSLNVPVSSLAKVLPVVDDFIVDIKDMDPLIYERYTGMSNTAVLKNLALLAEKVSPEHICIRVPRIPGFNTKNDNAASVSAIRELGFTQIEPFPYVIKKEGLSAGFLP